MKTFLNLMYVFGFICLVTIMDHRNTEIDRWMREHELARQIMMDEEADVAAFGEYAEIGRVSL